MCSHAFCSSDSKLTSGAIGNICRSEFNAVLAFEIFKRLFLCPFANYSNRKLMVFGGVINLSIIKMLAKSRRAIICR